MGFVERRWKQTPFPIKRLRLLLFWVSEQERTFLAWEVKNLFGTSGLRVSVYYPPRTKKKFPIRQIYDWKEKRNSLISPRNSVQR